MKRVADSDFLPVKPNRANRHAKPASSVRESEKGKDLKDSFPFGRSSYVGIFRSDNEVPCHSSITIDRATRCD